MATVRRNNYNRITRDSRRESSYEETYTSGNVVRYVETVPEERRRYRTTARERAVVNTERNRENALRVNASYVLFMVCICVTLIAVSVNYLQLQAEGTAYRAEIANMEGRLSDLRLSNENAYEHAMAMVDVEAVKKIAINQLGMRYAQEGQVITYNSQHGDYIRQYGEITAGE